MYVVAPDGDVPSVANDGTLAHVKGSASHVAQLVWTDRTGRVLGPIGPPQDEWPYPEVSPDVRPVSISAKEKEVADIWLHDAERGTRTRLQAGQVPYTSAVWSQDGSHLLYSEGASLPLTIKMKAADGSGEAKAIADGWGDPSRRTVGTSSIPSTATRPSGISRTST